MNMHIHIINNKPYNLYNNINFNNNNSPFHYNTAKFLFHTPKPCISMNTTTTTTTTTTVAKMPLLRASNFDEEGGDMTAEKRGFLSLEEAGLVEISGLNTHERFLCRLTISSLNLLRVIAEQEGCEIEELNAGRVCDWFLKDKLKREQNIGTPVLKWDDDDPFEDFM